MEDHVWWPENITWLWNCDLAKIKTPRDNAITTGPLVCMEPCKGMKRNLLHCLLCAHQSGNRMTSSNGNIFRVTGLCAGNSPITGEFPSQMCNTFVILPPSGKGFLCFFLISLPQLLITMFFIDWELIAHIAWQSEMTPWSSDIRWYPSASLQLITGTSPGHQKYFLV